EPKSDSSTISDALYFKASGYAVDYQHLICRSKESIDFIPASKMLASITSVLGTVSNSQQVLSELLKDEHIKENYDYVLIDCRPSLDLLVVNAFAASTGVIIPVQAEKFSLDAVSSTIDTFNRARTLNHDLQLVGLLVTMVDKRTTMSKAVEKALRNNYDNVFTTVIPRLAEAAISTYEQR
ncbi:MAG: AAA family ATPase, partial [Oscillospiraceae bacterium]